MKAKKLAISGDITYVLVGENPTIQAAFVP